MPLTALIIDDEPLARQELLYLLQSVEGVEVLALSALRHEPHPSHSTVEQSLEWSRRIGPQQTWFTHIAHDLGHEETNRTLPANVRLAYDGLSVPLTL